MDVSTNHHSQEHPGFRLFILGAGFSKPAGIPIANELFPLVLSWIERVHGKDTVIEKDLAEYIEYKQKTSGVTVVKDEINLEEFVSYLDLEHFLGMSGSKTLSSSGNGSQLLIRNAIGSVIQEHTPSIQRIPDVYKIFAERVSYHDVIITLNYDILLERAFEAVGKSYRLFPNRLETASKNGGIVDASRDDKELVIWKLHGSVDWFDIRPYEEFIEGAEGDQSLANRMHPVFGQRRRFDTKRIIEGPFHESNGLSRLYRVGNIDEFYQSSHGWDTPFILSPSYVKFVYADPLLNLWWGWGRAGALCLGLNIIGFSLPAYDDYFRILLYKIVSNYYSWWNEPLLEHLKDSIKIIDFKKSEFEQSNFKKIYQFIDQSKLTYWFDGLNDDSIDFLFRQNRT